MSYSCEKLQDLPISIFAPLADWDWADMPLVNAELEAIWEASSVPMIHITDFSNQQLSYDALVKGTANAGLGSNPLFSHPNVKEIIIVTTQDAVVFAINQISSGKNVYQMGTVRTMPTLDEALRYARQQF